MLKQPPLAPRRPWVPRALLAATLALAGVLAYEANDAARSHRAAVERALQDYASFAAWQFVRNAKVEMWHAMALAFGPVIGIPAPPAGTRAVALPSPARLAHTADTVARCVEPGNDDRRFYFRVDLRDRSLALSGAPPPVDVRGMLVDTIVENVPRGRGADAFELVPVFREDGGTARALPFVVVRDQAGDPVAAYGFETCLSAFGAPMFHEVMRRSQVLPPALAGPLPNDSLFSVSITDGSGHVVYRSPTQYVEAYAGGFASGKGVALLETRVALRPDAAGRLVIGGVPPSRQPLLLGLLAMAAALVALVLLQLRREQEHGRLRAEFVSGISHELRTPLAQIRMFGETLRLGRVRSEAERQRSLEIIDQEARRLAHLVENVLQFSRADAGDAGASVRLAPEPVQLARAAREALEAFAPIASGRRVTLRAAAEGEVVAAADRGALRQILLNLLDNAAKYGPIGQTVTVGVAHRDGRALITVDDEGPGVPAAERARVWQPFVRLASPEHRATTGSGIGLAVVRELVLSHGGRAWVEDGMVGARFVVELPAAAGYGPRAMDSIDRSSDDASSEATDLRGPQPAARGE